MPSESTVLRYRRLWAVVCREDIRKSSGAHDWENRLEDGIWTYSLDDIWTGLTDCYGRLAGDYMDIWDSTGTTVSSESGGITYGSTTIGNIGPGFVDFCAGKNVSVTQNTDYSPNYNFFTNCIDRGDIAVVHCGIISSDTGERAGHSMAAEGYATLRAYNSGNTVHTLMVFDGWGDTVRYLNFDFDSWTDISGTTFNG